MTVAEGLRSFFLRMWNDKVGGFMTYEVRNDVKGEVARRGRRLRDLAREMGYDYDRLTRILNGYRRAPDGFESRVREALRRWDGGGLAV